MMPPYLMAICWGRKTSDADPPPVKKRIPAVPGVVESGNRNPQISSCCPPGHHRGKGKMEFFFGWEHHVNEICDLPSLPKRKLHDFL